MFVQLFAASGAARNTEANSGCPALNHNSQPIEEPDSEPSAAGWIASDAQLLSSGSRRRERSPSLQLESVDQDSPQAQVLVQLRAGILQVPSPPKSQSEAGNTQAARA